MVFWDAPGIGNDAFDYYWHGLQNGSGTIALNGLISSRTARWLTSIDGCEKRVLRASGGLGVAITTAALLVRSHKAPVTR